MRQPATSITEQIQALAGLAPVYVSLNHPPEACEAIVRSFHQAVRALPIRDELDRVLCEIQALDLEDDYKTLIERTVLAETARLPRLSMLQIRTLFNCGDWEALKVLARNRAVDDFTRRRADDEAYQIMQAKLSEPD